MGASHPGDIKTLVETAEPDYGIVTNVGRAHLQGFGSFEGVMQTKGELYDFLAARSAPVFIHAENEHLMSMARQRGLARLVDYSTTGDTQCFVSGTLLSANPCVNFEWGGSHVLSTHLVGGYNLPNLMAAVCVGRYFDVSPEQINHALAAYVPTNNRSQMVKTERNTLIVDAYNANPNSMMAALESFCQQQPKQSFLILGGMGELGDCSQQEHRRIADWLAAHSFSRVWLVGSEFADIHPSPDFRLFKDVEEVKAALEKEQPSGFTVLIKGSNSKRLYELPPYM